MWRVLWAVVLLSVPVTAGCPAEPADDGDLDGDGFLPPEDCQPSNGLAFPGAEDVYGDGSDQNCDGADGVDRDGDTYPSNVAESPAHRHLQDCNDDDPSVHPGAADLANDGEDNDCDGVDGVDADEDGWASVATGGRDCDDTLFNHYPGATDLLGDGRDQDCDGVDGTDADRDGWASAASWGQDCDDEDPAVHPEAFDACDGLDTDCQTDPGEVDADSDGFFVCDGDCADGDPTIHPGAAGLCDALDRDCDGNADSVDADNDGLRGCDGDCDDADAAIHPGATEACNLRDDDCNGALPPAELDSDNDGITPCQGDCDDGDAAVFPGSWSEVAGDGTDTDCDGADTAPALSGASGVLVRDTAVDRFGAAICAGDVVGDGLSDLVLAAPGSAVAQSGSSPQGRVHILQAQAGISTAWDVAATWPDGSMLDGEAAFDSTGASVTTGFDVDGDGHDDVLVGAYTHNGAGQNAGKVYLFLGSRLALGGYISAATADYAWTGAAADDEAGISVAAGDVDGDGLDDLVVGADGVDSAGAWTGAAYIVLGSSLGAAGGPAQSLSGADYVIQGESSGHFFGTAVASGGDVDGDGTDDVLVGAPPADGEAPGGGRVYVFYGSDLGSPGTRSAASADLVLRGTVSNGQMGKVVGLAEDMDGDGRAEVLVGSPTANGDAGLLRLWFAAVLPAAGTAALDQASHTFEGGPGDGLGRGVSAQADVDGDGLADLLVGAPGAGAGRGEVGLWLSAGLGPVGSHTMASAEHHWTGEAAADAAGWSVAGVPDVDGDGRDDLLVGSFQASGATSPGRVWLLLSPL